LQKADHPETQTQPLSLEISVDDFVRSNITDWSDYQALYKDLAGLLALFDAQLVSKVLPATNAPPIHVPNVTPIDVPSQPRLYPLPRNVIDDRTLIDDENQDDRLRDPRFRRPRGDFEGDLNPFAPASGNLMGPRNFPFPNPNGDERPSGLPGLAPRFDPYGPKPGMGEPDFDELVPRNLGGGPRGPFNGSGPRGPFRGQGPPFL